MRAVDTNVLVRLLVRDDPRQTEEAEAFVANGVWASLLALAETVWVLDTVFGFNAKDQANAITVLLDIRQLVVQDQETVAAALRLFQAKPSLGFSDCLMLEIARRAGHLPLGTFDRNLAKIEGAQRISSVH